MTLSGADAYGHPAYDGAVQRAAARAFHERNPAGDRTNDPCFSVYYDGTAMFVRDSKAVKPPDSVCVCIAQYWGVNATADGRALHTVQLRFNGAWSEWVHF